MAITWKNVTGPDFSSSSNILNRAESAFDRAITGLTDIGADQREMNIFKAGEQRAADIQQGKEAILSGSATLDDWKKMNLEDTLSPYQDTKVRAELMDYFNKRDDTLREETKADLSIERSGQIIRHADAQELRNQAEEKRKDVRLAIASDGNRRANEKHDEWERVILQNRSDEDRLTAIQNVISNMVADDATEDDINETIESMLAEIDENGKPIISTRIAKQVRNIGTQGMKDATTLVGEERTKFDEGTALIQAKYNNEGIGYQTDPVTGKILMKDGVKVKSLGLAGLDYGIQENNEIISKFQETEKTILDNAKGFKTRNAALESMLSKGEGSEDNLSDLKGEVDEEVKGVQERVIKSVKEQLIAKGVPEYYIDKNLKGLRLNEELVVSALSATTATEDFWGEDYDITNLAPFRSRLQADAVSFYTSKILAEQATLMNKSLESDKSAIQKKIASETEELKRNILSKAENESIIKGK